MEHAKKKAHKKQEKINLNYNSESHGEKKQEIMTVKKQVE